MKAILCFIFHIYGIRGYAVSRSTILRYDNEAKIYKNKKNTYIRIESRREKKKKKIAEVESVYLFRKFESSRLYGWMPSVSLSLQAVKPQTICFIDSWTVGSTLFGFYPLLEKLTRDMIQMLLSSAVVPSIRQQEKRLKSLGVLYRKF